VDHQQSDRTRDFERFITFVDAIVAIAITLLVLPLVDVAGELRRGGSVADLLQEHQAQIWAFLLSFVVIAGLWFSQHHAIRSVVAHDPAVTRLLMIWTLTIVVLPFPTALLAGPDSGHQPATKIFYIGTMTLSSVCLSVICVLVGRNRAIRDSDETPDAAASIGSSIAFVVALAITLVFPATSYWPLLLLLVPDRVLQVWRRPRNRRRPSLRVGE
jgi:uncharacterized membrane protein